MDGLSSQCSSVLLLGEGNFSFARSLSQKLAEAVQVVATSFEGNEAVCRRKYSRENIDALTEKGVRCLFGVDATAIHTTQSLEGLTFDGIIFNFPHIPGKANIAKNRNLLKNFFRSCVQKLTPAGQVLVTLCNGQGGTPADQPQREKQNSWQVVDMATYGDLILTKAIPFRAGEYQEYDSTGYRNQDKGFLTECAVTYVFERSYPIPVLLANETFSTNVDGKDVKFHCPPDIGMYMERNLLSDKSHPLNLLKTALVSTIQKLFPNVEVLQECDLSFVVSDALTNGCSGVYRLKEPLTIHEPGESTGDAWMLRPHLLCHAGSLIDRYASEGCVLPGRSYHRCAITLCSFPIMHQMLVALPHSENVVDVVTKVFARLHGDKSHLQLRKRKSQTVASAKLHTRAGENAAVRSPKRRRSEVDETGTLPGSSDGRDKMGFDRCRACLEGQVDDEHSIHLVSLSGKRTTLGLCGTTARDATNNDIILLYLDQLIMHLLDIDDIRLLWLPEATTKERSTGEFPENRKNASDWFTDITLASRSIYPPLYTRDVSFWVKDRFDELRFMSVLRQATGMLLRRAWLKEVYHDEERGDASRCYRLEYVSCDRALSKDRLAKIHQRVLELIREEMGLVAR